MKLSEYLVRVEADGRPAMFMGDGAAAFESVIRERLGERAHFAPMEHTGLRAGCALALAQRRADAGEALTDCITLAPLYLRAPQAERERAAREAAKEGAHG